MDGKGVFDRRPIYYALCLIRIMKRASVPRNRWMFYTSQCVASCFKSSSLQKPPPPLPRDAFFDCPSVVSFEPSFCKNPGVFLPTQAVRRMGFSCGRLRSGKQLEA